jgi:hypothetical protein
MPEVMLARPGASIKWAADQILRSDINRGDIVVWGLTTLHRTEYAVDWELKTTSMVSSDKIIPKELRYYNLDYFDSTTNIVSTIRAILQVVNFCEKIGAQLYLANLLEITWFPIIFKDYKDFINLAETDESPYCFKFIDKGTDNIHPGPKQHQQYAKQIFDFIKNDKHEESFGNNI